MRRLDLVGALGVVLLVDVLRDWLPAVITIFGQAGSTPAEQLGGFALLWFVLAFAGPALAHLAGPARVGLAVAVVLAACRLGLVFTSGQALLYVASAGLLAGLVWVASAAYRGYPMAGPVLGLAGAAALHAARGTVAGLKWPVAVAFVALAVAAYRDESAGGSSAAWFLLGPVMLLALQLALAPALVSTGLSYLAGPAGVAATPGIAGAAGWTAVTAVDVGLFCWLAFRPPVRRWSRVACAVALVVAAAGLRVTGGRWLLVAVLLAAPALGGCLGMACQGRSGSPLRRSYAAVAGMLILAVAAFAYYAAYDAGYPNAWVPPLVAVLVGGVALRAAAPAPAADRPRPALRPVAVTLAGAAALAAIGAPWSVPAQAAPGDRSELRLVAYNIRMGHGLDGRLSIRALADVIRSAHPDVVALSEVDRGWLVNGGHDDLTLLARAVGMRYLFAPAADSVWGDAVLTRLPVVSARSLPLRAYGAPIGAQALGVVLRRGSGEVAVVATHLQPPPGRRADEQARAVAQFAAGLGAPGRPVVVAGDLNTEPGEAAFGELERAGLRDALAGSRPLPTDPSDAPREQLDHVFVSAGTAREVGTPRSTASDHLPVVVTLTW